MTDKLMTISECAEALRCSRQTIYRWLRQGRLPFQALGPKSIRIREQDLKAFVEHTYSESSSFLVVQPTNNSARQMVKGFAFGKVQVLLNSIPITDNAWRSKKAKELIFYLLWEGRPILKDRIIEEFWPESPKDRGNEVLHTTVYRVRQALVREAVLYEEGCYSLGPAVEWEFDATKFLDLLNEAASKPRDTLDRVSVLRKALLLYQGPFLEGFFSEWCSLPRFTLENHYTRALAELSTYEALQGNYHEAIRLSEQITKVDEFQEEAWRNQIRYYILSGDRMSALRAYRLYAKVVREELGIEPPDLLRLSEQVQERSPL